MSQLKLDLISIGEQLPPNFFSSFINRLSPKTYLRLRRTCFFINKKAEKAVDNKRIYVVAKNKSIQLDILEPYYYHVSHCVKFENCRMTYEIEDCGTIFGFHYNEVYLRYYGTPDLSATEIQELDDFINLLLHLMRCDTFHLISLPDPDNLVKFLPVVQPRALEIWDTKAISPLTHEPLHPELNHLKEPEMQKIPHLTVRNCNLSYRFNLLDLCKERQSLELWLKESWEDSHPMICQFIQDVYNGANIGPLQRFTISAIQPPSWKPYEPDWEELSPSQLGNIPFIVLKPPSCRVKYAQTASSALYYCETSTKKLLLLVRPYSIYRIDYIRLDLYIIPLDDFSNFMGNLADIIYTPRKEGYIGYCEPGTYPIDNSHLSSLLQNVPPGQYAPILENYITNLNTHMNLDEFFERKRREELEKDAGSVENQADV